MYKTTVFSIIESPTHKNFSGIYQKNNLEEIKLNSIRKANTQLKRQLPDIVVAEFFYAYGSNYSGVHISNLDVFLVSLTKYKSTAKVIVMVDKSERQYVDKLNDIYPVNHILQQPVSEKSMDEIIAAICRL